MKFHFKYHDPKHQKLANLVQEYQKREKFRKSYKHLILYVSLLLNIGLLTTIIIKFYPSVVPWILGALHVR